ncbi:MAG TPA: hypothetical protein VHL52_02525 [Acidimicrobiia bacterium]|nr:hypothetical protein [Acidimicrobiia bacterium]
MADDVQVVVEDSDVEELPPSPPRGWLAWLGLAALTLVLLAGTFPPGSETPTTTFPPIPTVAVPEVVAQTLTWEQATGFEEAEHIGGVTRFDGAWWAVGSTDVGLGVWSSDGQRGQSWKLASRPGGDEVDGWVVTDVDALDGNFIVTAGPENGLTGGSLFESGDGVTWEQRRLSSSSARLQTIPHRVIPTRDGVIIRGFGTAGFAEDRVVGLLPDRLHELHDNGHAEFVVNDSGQVIVFVPPGIEIDRFQAGDLSPDLPMAPERSPQVWRGPSLDALEVSREEWFPWDVQPTADGTLMAPIGIQLAFSEDGEDWKPVGPRLDDLMGFVPWKDGAAATLQDGELQYWTPDSTTMAPLLPDEVVDSTTQFSQVVADDAGLAALVSGVSSTRDEESRTQVAEVDGTEMVLTRGLTLELFRGDERLWSDLVWNTPVTLEEGNLLRFGEPPDTIGVPIEDWMEALRQHTRSQGADGEALEIVHSSDGQNWSSSTWTEITGREIAAAPRLFATDDFILAVDQTRFPMPYMNGAWLGRPTG